MLFRVVIHEKVVPDSFDENDWSITVIFSSSITVNILTLPHDGYSPITDIQYRVDAGSWVSSGGTGSFSITGLSNGTEYDIELRAVNSVGAGDASDTKQVTPATVPSALTSGQWEATAGTDKIDVVVTTPPSNGGSAITDYEWELDASGTWVSGGGTTFSITGLTGGTAYAVRVRAKNAIGAADPSDSKTRTPPLQVAMSAGGTPITLESLFDSEEWLSITPKTVTLASGSERGSTDRAVAAVSIGTTPWVGELTFNVDGIISGEGGPGGTSGNGIAGGAAFNANITGNTGQKITVIVGATGVIRGGGGGGAAGLLPTRVGGRGQGYGGAATAGGDTAGNGGAYGQNGGNGSAGYSGGQAGFSIANIVNSNVTNNGSMLGRT